MPYETYKVLHLAFIFLFLTGLAISFFAQAPTKMQKMITGISSLLIFVAGMGLIARLNIGHGEPWPLWIKVKIGLWACLAMGGPILSKRLSKGRTAAFYGLILLAVATAATAIYKP